MGWRCGGGALLASADGPAAAAAAVVIDGLTADADDAGWYAGAGPLGLDLSESVVGSVRPSACPFAFVVAPFAAIGPSPGGVE